MQQPSAYGWTDYLQAFGLAFLIEGAVLGLGESLRLWEWQGGSGVGLIASALPLVLLLHLLGWRLARNEALLAGSAFRLDTLKIGLMFVAAGLIVYAGRQQTFTLLSFLSFGILLLSEHFSGTALMQHTHFLKFMLVSVLISTSIAQVLIYLGLSFNPTELLQFPRLGGIPLELPFLLFFLGAGPVLALEWVAEQKNDRA
jgi:hypothetical protein